MAEGTQYGFLDLIWGRFKAKRLSAEEYRAALSRARVIDDTWTMAEQLASERYQRRQAISLEGHTGVNGLDIESS